VEWPAGHYAEAQLAEPLFEKLNATTGDGLFSHEATRIHRCDVETRSEIWLTLEQEPSPDALVYFNLNSGDSEPEFSVKNGQILAVSYLKKRDGWNHCKTALIRLEPEGVITARTIKARWLLHIFRPEVSTTTVTLESDGRIWQTPTNELS
jgi:hypothetical protein